MSIQFDHLVLKVSNFTPAKGFYKKLFDYAGWQEVADPESKDCVGYRQVSGLTIWLEQEDKLSFGKRFGWLDHFAFSCDSRSEVDDAFKFCSSNNWTILAEPKHYPEYGDFYGFAFAGFDGLKLEFVCHHPS